MQRHQASNPGAAEVPVEDLLAFGRLKDSRDPSALNAWNSYEKHGDKTRLNLDIIEVVRQSKQGSVAGSFQTAVQANSVSYSEGKLLNTALFTLHTYRYNSLE
jgi:hypothetical protein